MIKKVWNKIRNSKHWERKMGWEYFALIALGSLIAGILTGMAGWSGNPFPTLREISLTGNGRSLLAKTT
jgi:hypothetical protein